MWKSVPPRLMALALVLPFAFAPPSGSVTALSVTQATAPSAEAEGLYQTAQDYQHGRNGRPQNDVEARRLYRQAALAGHIGAMYALGDHHYSGVRRNEDLALMWYREAARRGHAGAMYNMGIFYEEGRADLTPSHSQALSWFRRAAEAGNASARSAVTRVEQAIARAEAAAPRPQPQQQPRNLVYEFRCDNQGGFTIWRYTLAQRQHISNDTLVEVTSGRQYRVSRRYPIAGSWSSGDMESEVIIQIDDEGAPLNYEMEHFDYRTGNRRVFSGPCRLR